jgi:hypothetical protein
MFVKHISLDLSVQDIHAFIRQIHKNSGLKPLVFARSIGSNGYRLSLIEHGRVPSRDVLETLQKNYNIEIIWPEIPVNKMLSPQEIDIFLMRNFSEEKLFDRHSLDYYNERMRKGTPEKLYEKYLTNYLDAKITQNPKISDQELAKLRDKWLEPLTFFTGIRNFENVPRGILHELALPHGASDGLIIDPARGLVLVNFKAKKDTASQEGIGGHKKSGLTFRENMVDEFLEEVFGLPEKKGNAVFMPDEQAIYDRVKDEYKPLVEQNLFYTGSRTTNANFNNIDNQINIHVSDLYVLRLSTSQIPNALNSEASSGHRWVAFAEADQIARTPDGFFFGILWNNLVRTAGGINKVADFVASLKE